MRCFCSPQRTDSALYPSIGQLERAAGFEQDDTAGGKLDKLDILLARSVTSREDSALLAELLSLPNDGRYPALSFEPQQRRKKTLEALLTQIESLARSEPVLIIFEDAHWTDPTSQELFGRIVERIVTLRVLLIITYRPEFDSPWIGLPHVTAITVNRLGPRDINTIIDRIVGNKFLPPDVREDMIERTDGIPLFIEEMTKALLEAESEEEARRTTAATPSPRLEIPATLHASLMSRLDRLGPAKELAQIGAAIGREFSHALIEAIAGKSQLELDTAIHRLIGAGLLFRQGAPPYANYVFKHALVQDAAYSTLLRERRRALHTKIAEALEARFPDTVQHHPELLAHHCTEAGLIEKAASLWGRAGQRSLERSAVAEAVEQLSRALSQIAVLPSTPSLRGDRIKLQVAVANALPHRDRVENVRFSPSGKYLASGDKSGFAHIWDVANSVEIATSEQELIVWQVVFSQDERWSAAATSKKVIILLVPSGRQWISVEHHKDGEEYGSVRQIVFSPDSKYLLSAVGKSAILWNVETGGELHKIEHEHDIVAADFSSDGQLIASSDDGGDVVLTDVPTGKKAFSLRHGAKVWSVVFSTDHTLITGSADHNLRFWDSITGTLLQATDLGDEVMNLTKSSDGKYLAVAVGGAVQVWEVETKRRAITIERAFADGFSFTSDDRVLATSRADAAQIWDLRAGKLLATLGHQDHVVSALFSPDNRLIATGSWDKSVQLQLWRVSDLIHEACSRVGRNLTSSEWAYYISSEPFRKTCPNLH